MIKAHLLPHLRRIHQRSLDVLADEVRQVASLNAVYPNFGDSHPAYGREQHIQSVLFAGYRRNGYFSEAETWYFEPKSNSRQIDLSLYIPDARCWLFMEVKPCGPQAGAKPVIADAKKLLADETSNEEDRLRGVLAYGFRHPLLPGSADKFEKKYAKLGVKLATLGFQQVGIDRRDLTGTEFAYVQVGLWVVK